MIGGQRRHFSKYGPVVAAICPFMAIAPAAAQTNSTVLITPSLPIDFDRGRNISVEERPRTDYDQLGIRLGSIVVKPKVDLSLGYTDNAYLAGSSGKKGAAFVSAVPIVTADSDWDRDEVNLFAAAGFQRYFGETRRNQDTYDLRAVGRKDIGESFSLTGETQYARLYESPQTGATTAQLSVLSHYRRLFGSIRGQYTSGRGRVILAVDHTGLAFDDIDLGNNVIFGQKDRDRTIDRVTGQIQYALSPSISVYGQAGYDKTDYSQALLNSGAVNRNSDGWRVLGGVNFDLAGFMRGQVGVGYVRRNYDAAIYKDVSGLSAEALVEFFPTNLTTLSLRAGRTVEDASVSNSGAYFDTYVRAGADHEFLANLIGGVTAEYRHQTQEGTAPNNDFYGAYTNLRYFSSRFFSLFTNAAWIRRTTNGGGPNFSEVRAVVGITLQR
jgi:hypothetical protein